MNFSRLNQKRLILCLLVAGILSLINASTMADDTSTSIIAGCASQPPVGYGNGFVKADLSLTNVDVDGSGHIVLNTGNQALDPNNIVIPFEQEVSVTFIFEGGDYTKRKLGWLFAKDGPSGAVHPIYDDLNDDLDTGKLPGLTDTNGDGDVNVLDNKKVLGTFAAGTELVFRLEVGDQSSVYYTKTAWNSDVYDTNRDTVGGEYDRIYNLGAVGGGFLPSAGWMTSSAVTRLQQKFGITMQGSKTIHFKQGEKIQHVIVGAPPNDQNQWILGWEDQKGCDPCAASDCGPTLCRNGNHTCKYPSTDKWSECRSDFDMNDLVFRINRKTGGTAELPPDVLVNGQLVGKSIKPEDPDAFFTSVLVEVFDDMPCAGKSNIIYSVSSDNGVTWIPVTTWDEVRVSNASQTKTGDIVSDWTPGKPQITYRKALIDLASSGKIGQNFIWKAQMTSDIESCVPKIININFTFTVSKHGVFARSAPVKQVEMLYAGSYETPESTWSDYYLRGHLIATRLYNPDKPKDPLESDILKIWDAGERLSPEKNADLSISSRRIYIPRTDTIQVPAYQIAKGDASTRTFTYTIPNLPIQDNSIVITDTNETFTDTSGLLTGSFNGSGTIDRFTGNITINFRSAPGMNQPITLKYTYYKTYPDMKEFRPNNLTPADLGLTKDWYYSNAGKILYDYDFNNSCNGAVSCATAGDQNDANWLINWVRGYKDGRSTPKSWLLGAIDHSTPAIDLAPGKTSWYHGTKVSDAERQVYDKFMTDYKDKRAVAYVGSKDGMLHAFDAGLFRWGDNPKTTVKEEVGYFEWSGDTPDTADYGTGDELWAFIPINLVSRLKNNYLGKTDQAYVDASPTVADVFINNYGTEKWTSVLLSAEGEGGNTVFCLDVTTPSDPKFLWEYSNPNLEKSKSSPSVAKIGKIKSDGKDTWVAFFVSGKRDVTQNPSIYVIDIGSGNLLMQIFLKDTAIGDKGKGGVPSGQPAIIDSDGDGYIDRLYIGTDKGYLYKVNIPGDGTVTTCVLNLSDPHQPIQGTPAVLLDRGLDSDGNELSGVLIYYGTGDSPYVSNDTTDSTTYYFYAYKDSDLNGVCTPLTTPLWQYQMPAGEKTWTSAFAAAGRIYFGTTTNDTEDPCEKGGKTNGAHLYVFDQKPADPTTPLQVIATPNLNVAPLVDDGHLYIRDGAGTITTYGAEYNQPKMQNVTTQMRVKSWREIY